MKNGSQKLCFRERKSVYLTLKLAEITHTPIIELKSGKNKMIFLNFLKAFFIIKINISYYTGALC